MKVNFDTTLGKILEMKDGTEILQKNNVPCLNCSQVAQELNTLTIGEVSQIYQLDLNKILYELNQK